MNALLLQLPYFCFKHNKMKYIFPLVICFLLINCKNNNNGDEPDLNVVAAPAAISYNIINTFPHDTSSFTQGLQWYNNSLFEGTGNYGNSKLLKVDLQTGKPVKKLALNENFFGEGITILKDTLYQITWQEKTCFVYDSKS